MIDQQSTLECYQGMIRETFEGINRTALLGILNARINLGDTPAQAMEFTMNRVIAAAERSRCEATGADVPDEFKTLADLEALAIEINTGE